MTFLNVAQELRTSDQSAESSFFGIVEDNQDPLKLQRVRVRVIEKFGHSIPTTSLPWACPAFPAGLGSDQNQGCVAIPRIGSTVLVQFSKGSVYDPVYIAAPYSKKTVIDDAAENYPNRQVFRDPNGNKVIIDNTPDSVDSGNVIHIDNTKTEVTITLKSGASIKIGADGSAQIHFPANSTITTDSKLTLVSDLHVDGKITCTSTIDADGSISSADQVSDSKSSMDDMRTTYNSHKHPTAATGPASTPTVTMS